MLSISLTDPYRSRNFYIPHTLIYSILISIIIGFVILTIVFGSLWLKCDPKQKRSDPILINSTIQIFNCSNNLSNVYAIENGIIGFPPILPNDGTYIQWTFLHMNDVYELLPLDQGRRGGLARVAYIRNLLLKENNNTITFLAGDLVSPSAISTLKINGTSLNGKQMIATMNTLGLDYITFGNHEFDLNETELLARMTESKFTWISSNVFRINTTQPFGLSIPYKLITIQNIRILIIGLTVDGNGNYVTFINQSSLVNYTKEFLNSFPNDTYDILVALTHLDITTDIQLVTNIPQIDLILGGHEHENYQYLRGKKYTPIYKADSNAFTVYIHRCAFNINKRQFRIYSTLAKVSSDIPEEETTAKVANYWFNLGIEGFQALGYQPLQILSCLPNGIELDGKYESVTSTITLLTEVICQSLIYVTKTVDTTIALINGGTIRIDDILPETIRQYDILRTLPFPNKVVALSVPGQIIAQVLTDGMLVKGTGMFIGYTGIETKDSGSTWLVNGVNITTSGLMYKVATTAYVRDNTKLKNAAVITLAEYDMTQTNALINYLPVKYSPC